MKLLLTFVKWPLVGHSCFLLPVSFEKKGGPGEKKRKERRKTPELKRDLLIGLANLKWRAYARKRQPKEKKRGGAHGKKM